MPQVSRVPVCSPPSSMSAKPSLTPSLFSLLPLLPSEFQSWPRLASNLKGSCSLNLPSPGIVGVSHLAQLQAFFFFLCVHLSCGGTCPWLREQVREPVTCLGKQLFLTFCRTLSCLVNLVSSSVKWDNKQVAYSYGGSSCHRVSAQC